MLGNLETMGSSGVAVAAMGIGVTIRLSKISPLVIVVVANTWGTVTVSTAS